MKKETREYIADFLIPCVRSAGKRVARDGHEAGLTDLLELRDEVDKAIVTAIAGLRAPAEADPLPWDLIGRGLGVTKAAAIKRFGPLIATVAGSSPSAAVARMAG